ncbi:MAG: hypothetical protein ONB15_03935 [candidate division KSB1 bacterium]|nr:hypothetical protein [candidate division KSB1 bacterium]
MAKPASQEVTGTLRDFLQELLHKLARFAEGWLSLQQQVVDELLESKSGAVKKFVETFGGAKLFLVVRGFWHPRFRRHLDQEPPQESVLCAFAQVTDNVITQEGLNAFVQWATRQESFSSQIAENRSTDPRVGQEVNDLNEVIAAISYFHCNPPGQKPVVRGQTLRAHLREAVSWLTQQGFVRRVLGGASGIISDILAQLGLPQVHLYAMYHSDVMASLYQGQPLRLDLNTNPPQVTCVNQPGTYQVGGELSPQPTRSSDIFTYKQGHTTQVGNRSCTARHDDRVIFRVYRYVGAHQGVWDQVRMRFLESGHPTPWFPGPAVDPDEWPFFSGFVRWRVDNRTLWIEYLDKAAIDQISNYDYIILNAPALHTYSQKFTDPVDYMGTESLRQQLEWIAKGPAKIHLEISGGADPGQDRIRPFAQALRGVIRSAGINDGELLQITSLPDYVPPVTVTGGASAIYQRYERAMRLAQELHLERLYIHGNDVDLILRKGGSPGDMRAEIQADLFAKGIVVLAVLQRTIGDWRGYLEADYAMATARDIIAQATKEAADEDITRAEKALKAAEKALRKQDFTNARNEAQEAQRIIEQAFGITSGPGRATLSLSPILLANGFRTLIEFAYDFSRFTLRYGDPDSPSGLTKVGEEIFQFVVETGYHVARDPGAYSVAVVPVMWPELPIELNPTGAGDICSGVCAVYSGF